MPVIANIGSVITVTPLDEIQIIHAPKQHEFIDDQSPFTIKVTGLIKEAEIIIGVYGNVISGHERYRGLIATLFVRLDNTDWTRDNQSHANFKVGLSLARPNGKHPFFHPDGTSVDGFPKIIRFAAIDSRAGNETPINSAMVGLQEPEN